MNKHMWVVFSLALILSLFLSSCAAVTSGHQVPAAVADGYAYALSSGATLKGIQMIMQGAYHTIAPMIYEKESMMVFVWPLYNDGIAVYMLDVKGAKQITDIAAMKDYLGLTAKGNVVNWKTTSEFLNCIKSAGYKEVTPITMAAVNRKAILDMLAATGMSQMSNALPTFVFTFTGTAWDSDDIYNLINPTIDS